MFMLSSLISYAYDLRVFRTILPCTRTPFVPAVIEMAARSDVPVICVTAAAVGGQNELTVLVLPASSLPVSSSSSSETPSSSSSETASSAPTPPSTRTRLTHTLPHHADILCLNTSLGISTTSSELDSVFHDRVLMAARFWRCMRRVEGLGLGVGLNVEVKRRRGEMGCGREMEVVERRREVVKRFVDVCLREKEAEEQRREMVKIECERVREKVVEERRYVSTTAALVFRHRFSPVVCSPLRMCHTFVGKEDVLWGCAEVVEVGGGFGFEELLEGQDGSGVGVGVGLSMEKGVDGGMQEGFGSTSAPGIDSVGQVNVNGQEQGQGQEREGGEQGMGQVQVQVARRKTEEKLLKYMILAHMR